LKRASAGCRLAGLPFAFHFGWIQLFQISFVKLDNRRDPCFPRERVSDRFPQEPEEAFLSFTK
jgi:hypothetical protein